MGLLSADEYNDNPSTAQITIAWQNTGNKAEGAKGTWLALQECLSFGAPAGREILAGIDCSIWNSYFIYKLIRTTIILPLTQAADVECSTPRSVQCLWTHLGTPRLPSFASISVALPPPNSIPQEPLPVCEACLSHWAGQPETAALGMATFSFISPADKNPEQRWSHRSYDYYSE